MAEGVGKLTLAFILLFALAHGASQDSYPKGTLMEGEILDLTVDEIISGPPYLIVDTYSFYVPDVELGKDAWVMKEFSYIESEGGQAVTHKVYGEDFVILYLGSSGMPSPYPEGFLGNLDIVFNGKALKEKFEVDRGWKRMPYQDGSENINVYVQYADLNPGGENKLIIFYEPQYSVQYEQGYYENMDLALGRFYSVINATYDSTPLRNNTFDVTFHIKNVGEAEYAGSINLYIYSGSLAASSPRITDVFFEEGKRPDFKTIEPENWMDAEPDHVGISLKGLDFSEQNQTDITLRVQVGELSQYMNYDFNPAYSYIDDKVVYLGPRSLAKGKKLILLTDSERICRKNRETGDCGIKGELDSLASSFYGEGYDVEIVDIDSNGRVWTSTLSNSASRYVHGELWKRIGEDDISVGREQYVIIVGDFTIIPLCAYEDDLENEAFVSDHCYSARDWDANGGPVMPQIAVSRIPYKEFRIEGGKATGKLGDYLETMEEFHSKKTNHGNMPDCLSMVKMGEVYQRNVFADFAGKEYYPPSNWGIQSGDGISLASDGTIISNKHPVQFYFLHSNAGNARWYHSRDFEGSAVVSENTLPPAGAVVFSTACYGGYAVMDNISIPYRWISQKESGAPNAFIGAESKNYFGGHGGFPVGSDLLAARFYTYFHSGETVGSSFMHSKQWLTAYDYKKESAWNEITGLLDAVFYDDRIDKMNAKVVMSNDLYGDPTLDITDFCGGQHG